MRRRGPRTTDAEERRLHRRALRRQQREDQSRTLEEEGATARTAWAAEESAAWSTSEDECFTLWHLNVRGWLSHAAEVTARLRLAARRPELLCLNETFLDRSTEDLLLEGYRLVARRDRSDHSGWGGVAVFAREGLQSRVTLLETSTTDERLWLTLHTDRGPYLLGVWYRPPAPGDTSGVRTFDEELARLAETGLGTVVVGDLNVHSRRWLRFSARESAEASALEDVCAEYGLLQRVREPTRKDYLLDLVLTTLEDVHTEVQPGVADHKLVTVRLSFAMPETLEDARKLWSYKDADWDGLRDRCAETDWSFLQHTHPDEGAKVLTQRLLLWMKEYVPERTTRRTKCTHPWLTEEVLHKVAAKKPAAGTQEESSATQSCSAAILAAYWAYVERTKKELRNLPRGSKTWWGRCNELSTQQRTVCHVPALRASNDVWHRTPGDKAQLVADTFAAKYTLAEAEENEYSVLCGAHSSAHSSAHSGDHSRAHSSADCRAHSSAHSGAHCSAHSSAHYSAHSGAHASAHFRDTTAHFAPDATQGPPTTDWTLGSESDALQVLTELRADSGTGPEGVPARVLKYCAAQLARPLLLLAASALAWGRWPEVWLEHWIPPLYKKGATWKAGNYRGVHLTAQLSKAAERLLQVSFRPYLCLPLCSGENQFAYKTKRGARDALAYLTLTWLTGFGNAKKFVVYCSDVSGAFDKVHKDRLVKKLRAKGVPESWVRLFASWLRERPAHVVVGGCKSQALQLKNMVFQSTVWGPAL